MTKTTIVAQHEYTKLVKKPSFLLTSLGFPILIALVVIISIVTSLGRTGDQPVGYIDNAGVIQLSEELAKFSNQRSVSFQSLIAKSDGLELLRQGQLQAVYVIPTDYLETGEIEVYYVDQRPSVTIQENFETILKANLLYDQPEEIQTRLMEGANIVIRSSNGNREFDSQNIITFLIPFIAAFLFVIAVMSAGGYMLEAVTKEKENRTIELLTTSLRPGQLIGGKALGLMGVGLTQLLIWAITGTLGLLVYTQFNDRFSGIQIPWSMLSIVLIFFLPAYVLMSGLMTIIGSIAKDTKQGQQISGIINILFTSPFFFMTLIMAKPNHPIVVGLSIFPTTAFITTTMRWAMTTIPIWQIISSFVILVLTASASIWAASRIFRIGMLRYGQSVTGRQILDSLRRNQPELHMIRKNHA